VRIVGVEDGKSWRESCRSGLKLGTRYGGAPGSWPDSPRRKDATREKPPEGRNEVQEMENRQRNAPQRARETESIRVAMAPLVARDEAECRRPRAGRCRRNRAVGRGLRAGGRKERRIPWSGRRKEQTINFAALLPRFPCFWAGRLGHPGPSFPIQALQGPARPTLTAPTRRQASWRTASGPSFVAETAP
jgi:hypothetical protein